jgi:DNA-binding transcriptional MerR regulator
MRKGYRIGEVAAKVGLTADTLRYYERVGVLPRAGRTTGGLRRYGDDVLRQVQFVRQARALGLTLKDVRQLLNNQGRAGRDGCRDVRDLLALRLQDVDGKLADLRAFRATLRAHLSDCERALESENPTCPVIARLGGTHR